MRKLINSKNLFLFACFFSLSAMAQNIPLVGQGNTQWKINGNIVDETHYFGTKNEFPLKFRSNDIERLRITSDGLIGIGTTTPQAKLDVFGNVIFRNSFSLPNLFQETSLLGKDLILVDGNGGVSRGGLDQLKTLIYAEAGGTDGSCGDGGVYNDNNPTWKNGLNKIFYKCPQIKVGIGTDNPNYNLHVNGTTFSSIFEGNRANFNERVTIGPDAINTNFKLFVNGNSKITGSLVAENAGIGGEVNQFAKLVVKNTSNGASLMIDQSENNNDYTKVIYAEIQNPTTEIIKVQNTQLNYTPFLLSSSGTMEIHNGTKKTFLLDATGFLKVRGLRIDQHDWADYVFDQNYELMPLYEVKKYVLENKHLPDMPSEEEVKTNGVDISELNKIYLQKIEELFLYSIEQKQELDELKQELQVLKEMLNK